MTTFHRFEEIDAWQESRKLVRAIRSVCKRMEVKRDFPFIDQITRAARSVSANIAEGSDSLSIPDFINFLGHSKKSAAEVRSHLYDALDESYISKLEFDDLTDHARKIGNMLGKLISYLQGLDHKRKRISPPIKRANP